MDNCALRAFLAGHVMNLAPTIIIAIDGIIIDAESGRGEMA